MTTTPLSVDFTGATVRSLVAASSPTSVTVAFGTTAPLGSITVTVRRAVRGAWASTTDGARPSPRTRTHQRIRIDTPKTPQHTFRMGADESYLPARSDRSRYGIRGIASLIRKHRSSYCTVSTAAPSGSGFASLGAPARASIRGTRH